MKTLPAKIRPHHSRGTTLIELSAALVILVGVAFVVSQLLGATFAAIRTTNVRDALLTRVDAAIDVLRHDTWNANAIRIDGQTIELSTSDGTITWHYQEGTLTRTTPGTKDRTRLWNDMPALEFSAAGNAPGTAKPLLVVSILSGQGAGKREQITLVSQRLVAGGAK